MASITRKIQIGDDDIRDVVEYGPVRAKGGGRKIKSSAILGGRKAVLWEEGVDTLEYQLGLLFRQDLTDQIGRIDEVVDALDGATDGIAFYPGRSDRFAAIDYGSCEAGSPSPEGIVRAQAELYSQAAELYDDTPTAWDDEGALPLTSAAIENGGNLAAALYALEVEAGPIDSLSLQLLDPLHVVGTDSDNYIIEVTQSFSGATYRYVIFRYRVISGGSVAGDSIYYATGGHEYSPSYYKIIGTVTLDGEWHIKVLDMHDLTVGGDDWETNTITALRIDLFNAVGVFEYDYVMVSSNEDGTGAKIVFDLSEWSGIACTLSGYTAVQTLAIADRINAGEVVTFDRFGQESRVYEDDFADGLKFSQDALNYANAEVTGGELVIDQSGYVAYSLTGSHPIKAGGLIVTFTPTETGTGKAILEVSIDASTSWEEVATNASEGWKDGEESEFYIPQAQGYTAVLIRFRCDDDITSLAIDDLKIEQWRSIPSSSVLEIEPGDSRKIKVAGTGGAAIAAEYRDRWKP